MRHAARKQVAANESPQCSQCYGFLISVAVLKCPTWTFPKAPFSCHPSAIPFVCLSFTYMHQPQISQWLVNWTCGEVNGWWYGRVEVQSTCLPPKYPPGPLSSSTRGGHSGYTPQAKKIYCVVGVISTTYKLMPTLIEIYCTFIHVCVHANSNRSGK